MLKANIVDFVKVMIRFEPLGVWDFGLKIHKCIFVLELKKKKYSNWLFMKLAIFFFFNFVL